MNLFLFASTVLIWGTSWIAIAAQVGDVPVVVSIFYRFAIAGVIMVGAFALFRILTLPRRQDWPWIGLQAVCLFSLNFICFYLSAAYITSGLIAVIFSLSVLFNAINARLFFKDRITPKVLVACGFGLTGLVCLFGPDIFQNEGTDTLIGIALACLGTLFFSLGNMISRRLSSQNVSPLTANAWGMCCGALLLLVMIEIMGYPLTLPAQSGYWISMFYLSVFGSILGFTAYLQLLARIGAASAAYTTILFPIVALTISTFVEGYHWTPMGMVGIVLALSGNIIMFKKPRKPALMTT